MKESGAHFFEGTEKLLEVWFARQQPAQQEPHQSKGSGDLRTIPRSANGWRGVGSERGEAAAEAALPVGAGRRGGRVPEWPGCGGALGGDGGRAGGRQVPGWPSVGAGLPCCRPPSRSPGDSPSISPRGMTFRRPPETLGQGGSPRPGGREVAVPGTEAIPRRHLVQPRAVPAGNMWRWRRSAARGRACAGSAGRERRGGSGRGVAVLLAAGARQRRPPFCGGSSRSYGQFRDEKAWEIPGRAVLRTAGAQESPSPVM